MDVVDQSVARKFIAENYANRAGGGEVGDRPAIDFKRRVDIVVGYRDRVHPDFRGIVDQLRGIVVAVATGCVAMEVARISAFYVGIAHFFTLSPFNLLSLRHDRCCRAVSYSRKPF